MRNGLSAERVTDPTKKTEDIDGALHFALAFGERFSFLPGEQFGQLGFSRLKNLGSFAENSSARDGCGVSPTGERGSGCFDGAGGIGFSTAGILGDFFLEVGGVEGLVSFAFLVGTPFSSD